MGCNFVDARKAVIIAVCIPSGRYQFYKDPGVGWGGRGKLEWWGWVDVIEVGWRGRARLKRWGWDGMVGMGWSGRARLEW